MRRNAEPNSDRKGITMHDPECIFCKIVEGEIPSNKVYEDDRVLAFEDLSPMMPVHTLVIPKNHYSNVASDMDDADKVAVIDALGKVAKIKGIEESGFRVITNAGDDACQTVHHLHFHVLGGSKMNDGNPSE